MVRNKRSEVNVPKGRCKRSDVSVSVRPAKRQKPNQEPNQDESDEAKTGQAKTEDAKTVERVDVDHGGVMARMGEGAKLAHDIAYPILLAHAKRLGFDQKSVDKTLEYIRERVPLVIHFHPRRLAALKDDTHYRNFEQVYGTFSNRTAQVESELFDKMYDNALAKNRVKYGALNLVNDPRGSKHARTYGAAYLLLKPHVRQRVTVLPCDSFCFDFKCNVVGTLDHCAHVFENLHISDEELTLAIHMATGHAVDDSVEKTYREIQIHGEIEFSKDIQSIVIPKRFKSAHQLDAEKFANKNNIALMWIN
jgi:hypothetical protein